jgi:hypothetical protein
MCGYDEDVASMQCTVPSTCNTGGKSLFTSPGSTCDPIFFRFGPFSASEGDFGCMCGTTDEWGMYEYGEFYIEITE